MMKRMLAIVAALALLLCACGQAEPEKTSAAPTTTEVINITEAPVTTEAITTIKQQPSTQLEPSVSVTAKATTTSSTFYTLTIVEQGWTGWSPEQPKPTILEDHTPVRVGDTFQKETWGGSYEIKIVGFTKKGAQVHFNTGCSEETPYGTISLMTTLGEWIETIPYGKTFEISTPTMDGGTSWKFTFTAPNGEPAKPAAAITIDETSVFLDLFEIGWSKAGDLAVPVKIENDTYVRVGDVFRGSYSGCEWEMTVIKIANADPEYDSTITLQFQTKGIVKAGVDGKVNLNSKVYDWTDTILFSDGAYRIGTQTQRQGMTWEFSFLKPPSWCL